MSDYDLLALSRVDLYSENGDYAYAWTSNFSYSLATSDPEDYPAAANGSFYLQIDGYLYFRWTKLGDEGPSKSAVDEEIFWSSWNSVDIYIHEFLNQIVFDDEFYVRFRRKPNNYIFKPNHYGEIELGEIEIISGEYPELEGECVPDTHFGDIVFYPLGEFSIPVTSIDAAVVSDTEVTDLTTCQKQCVSYAGCYQENFFLKSIFAKKTYHG